MPRFNLYRNPVKQPQGTALDKRDLDAIWDVYFHIGGVQNPVLMENLGAAREGNEEAKKKVAEVVRTIRNNLDLPMRHPISLKANAEANTTTGRDLLRILTAYDEPNKMGHNPHLTATHLGAILDLANSRFVTDRPTILSRVAQHPNLTKEQIHSFIKGSHSAMAGNALERLIDHRQFGPEHIDRFLRGSAPTYFTNVANRLMASKHFNDKHLDTFIERYPASAYMALQHPQQGPKFNSERIHRLIDELLSDGLDSSFGRETFNELAEHPNFDNSHIDKAVKKAVNYSADDGGMLVTRLLRADKFAAKLNEPHLENLATHHGDDSLTDYRILSHPKATPELAKTLFDRSFQQVKSGRSAYVEPQMWGENKIPFDHIVKRLHELPTDTEAERQFSRNVLNSTITRMREHSGFRDHWRQLADFEDKANSDSPAHHKYHVLRAALGNDREKLSQRENLESEPTIYDGNPDLKREILDYKPMVSTDEAYKLLSHPNETVATMAARYPHDAASVRHAFLDKANANAHKALLDHHFNKLTKDDALNYAHTMPYNADSDFAYLLRTRLGDHFDVLHQDDILDSPHLASLYPHVVENNIDNLTPAQAERLYKHGSDALKQAVMESPHATPGMFRRSLRNATHLVGGSRSDKNSRRFAHTVLAKKPDHIMPDDLYDRQVHVRFDTNKMRALRDHIESKGGVVHKKELEKAGLYNNNFGKLLDSKGNLTAAKLQEAIDATPANKYNLAFTLWDASQQHNTKPSKVMTLNLTNDHIAKLKQEGLWDYFADLNGKINSGSHPTHPHTLGWVRWTGHPKSGIFVDEMQSDLWRSPTQHELDHELQSFKTRYGDPIKIPDAQDPSKLKEVRFHDLKAEFNKKLAADPELNAIKQKHGVQVNWDDNDPNPANEELELAVAKKTKAFNDEVGKHVRNHFFRENPQAVEADAKHKKVMDILFGGKHPGETLLEGLHQYLRDKGYAGAKIATHSVPTKYPISLGDPYPDAKEIMLDPHKDAPVHMKQEYDQIPQKVFGWKKGKYGIGPNKATKEERRFNTSAQRVAAKPDLKPHEFSTVKAKQRSQPQSAIDAGNDYNIQPGSEIHEGIVRKIEAIRELIRKAKEE